nr:hypothetical protein [Tanacetum cinerariifolium]
KNYVELECLGYVLPQELSVGLILNGLTTISITWGRQLVNYMLWSLIYIPKPKNPKPSAKEHLAKDDTFHHCKEVGHCKRNFLAYLGELIKKKKQVGTAKNQLGKTIKALRSDRGGEYISYEFKDYLKACGIVQQLTPPYTPQHNGDYALESETRILNMVPTKKVDKTPYEL